MRKLMKAEVTSTANEINDKMRRRAAKLLHKGKTVTQIQASLGISQQRAAAMAGAYKRGAYNHLLPV